MNHASAYMVLNMAGRNLYWQDAHDGQRIPEESRPTFLHDGLESAQREALRLQQEHPLGRFVVFAATHVAVSIKAPTHCCLNGATFGDRPLALLCDVGDGIPF